MEEQKYQELYSYLKEEMSQEEQKAFEERVQKDKSLAQEIAFHQDLLKGVRMKGDEDLRASIRQTDQHLEELDFFHSDQTGRTIDMTSRSEGFLSRFSQPQYLTIAATVLLLIVAFIWFVRPKESYDQIYANHYESTDQLLEEQLEELPLMGFKSDKSQEQKSSLYEALSLYHSEDQSIETAIDALKAHADTYPKDEEAALFLGQAFMENQQYPQAAAVFFHLRNITDTYRDEAQWYLALATLKSPENIDAAKTILNSLASDSTSLYFTKAQEILNRLESMD